MRLITCLLGCLSLAGMGLCGSSSNGMVLVEVVGTQSSTPGTPASSVVSHRIQARDSEGSLQLQNTYSYYVAHLGIGTPQQNVSVIIDTGSSDLWVMDTNNPYCKQASDSSVASGARINCNKEFMFDHTSSSSFNFNQSSSNFSISYGDGSVADGQWSTDNIAVGSTQVSGVSFALAERSNSTQGVFGIGLRNGESTVKVEKNSVLSPTYDNFPIVLKNQGAIQREAYSLWLNDIESQTGNILFGGVDHAKYHGDLQLVPVVNSGLVSSSTPTSLSIMLHSISLYNNKSEAGTVAECSAAVLLDSGTTLSYLPSDIVDALGQNLGGTWSSQLGLYTMPCQGSGGLIFDFSGVSIETPLSRMMIPISGTGDGSSCALAIGKSSKQFILGDYFLRNAYVVYDLEGMQIGLAPALFNKTNSNMEAISTGIPRASSASSYSSTQLNSNVQTMSPSYSSTAILALSPSSHALSSGGSSTSPSSTSSSGPSLAGSSSGSSSAAPSSGPSSSTSAAASSAASSALSAASESSPRSGSASGTGTKATSSQVATSSGDQSGSADTGSSASASVTTQSSETASATFAKKNASSRLVTPFSLLTFALLLSM